MHLTAARSLGTSWQMAAVKPRTTDPEDPLASVLWPWHRLAPTGPVLLCITCHQKPTFPKPKGDVLEVDPDAFPRARFLDEA
ncbi:hypothetical protein Cob_v009044 [Colletotrichum orbiculare MAFF 240422]|uniref:Uncharacterized protein n=1 Tax=Colletotrichum orbiculare (strain 104-T / ATCC 96160 / CBS 514.97 / LARS 414 / MAFF 240422) TaxID=1213857 RepID=A0A484FJL8_COLOR|nr:hypothetical protein Cob_v009044 [Colletotrichum orbiculare MAFF 240422]